jgi:hypothetical protein
MPAAMPCADRLRGLLEAERAAGADFDRAWPAAVAAALERAPTRRQRDTWRAAFEQTREAWRRAYLGEQAGRPEGAIGAVGRYAAMRQDAGSGEAARATVLA